MRNAESSDEVVLSCAEEGCARTTTQTWVPSRLATPEDSGWQVSASSPLGAWCPHHARESASATGVGPEMPLRRLAVLDAPLSRRVADACVEGVIDLPLGAVPRACLLEWDALRSRMAIAHAASREVAGCLATGRASAEELEGLARCTAFVLLCRFVLASPAARVDGRSQEDVPSLEQHEDGEVLVRCLAVDCNETTHLKHARGAWTLSEPREPGWTRPPFVDSSLCPEHSNGPIATRRKRVAIASWNAVVDMATTDEPLPERVHRALVSGIFPLESCDVPPFVDRYWRWLLRAYSRTSDAAAIRESMEADPGKFDARCDWTLAVLTLALCRVPWDTAMVDALRPAPMAARPASLRL